MKNLILSFCILIGQASRADSPDADMVVSYMSYLSSQVVQRPLSKSELSRLRAEGRGAIGPVVTSWTTEPGFIQSAQVFVDNLFRTSGHLDGIDYDLPGNLGRDIARRQRPYTDLITADSCVDPAGNRIPCDTGAPYAAGALTTRAFLSVNKGAYNIGRAGKITIRLLCANYPYPEVEEPRLNVNELIPQFATNDGKITFGNGNNCYSCHSQFGRHAQFFVKFNFSGQYIIGANGQQAQGATDGFAGNGLATSHLKDPSKAASEASQWLGQPAANLREAAIHISKSRRFLPCAVQNLMRHYYRLSDQSLASIKPDLFRQIATDAQTLRADPSISHLLIALVSNPSVIDSFKSSGARP